VKLSAKACGVGPDGTRVPILPFPTPLRDASGALIGAVNMLLDISDRKRAEEQKNLLLRELAHRVNNTFAVILAITQLGNLLGASDRLAGLQRHGHGAIFMAERGAVGGAKPPAHAPFVAAENRAPAGKLDRGLIVVGDASIGVGRVDGGGQSVEQIEIPLLARLEALLGRFTLGDVLETVHATDEAAFVIEQRIEVGEDGDARSIRTLKDQLAVANWLACLEQLGHGRSGSRKRLAIGGERLVGTAEPVLPVEARRLAP
jgi:hypothetical protein